MKNQVSFVQDRPLDLICLGRAGVDFYADDIGARLEDAKNFTKYIGGSSTNIAFGAARLGLRSSMLTRVGDEHMGRFIRESLAKEGCDTSHVITDPERLTALVILGIKSQNVFPLIFYRENCADMAIAETDFDEKYIASSKAFLITGTHLSTSHMKAVSTKALEFARKNNTRTILDIDYRPVLWGLTGKGEGEQRFVESSGVTEHLQSVIGLFDLTVGTEEEFFIAGGSQDIIEALKNLRKISNGIFVVKRGEKGCAVFDEEIPDSVEEGFNFQAPRIEVLNVLGAGDAFMSGFLYGWIREKDYKACCDYANACGALVVSRHACSPSMPTPAELSYYMENRAQIPRPDKDTTLIRLHAKTTPKKQWKDLCIFAFDHRSQISDLFRSLDADASEIPIIKELMLKAFEESVRDFPEGIDTGVLIDGVYGQSALNKVTGRNFWIARPVELPGSRPIQFEGETDVGSRLKSWPQEHIVKCLVFFHPEDSKEMFDTQIQKMRELYHNCLASGHELLLEIIPPQSMPGEPQTIVNALSAIYDSGIYPDWWKLEPQTREIWTNIEGLINQRDPHCRGVVVLGLNAPLEDFRDSFKELSGIRSVKGFAIGRSVFYQPLCEYLKDRNEQKFISEIRSNFLKLVDFWKSGRC